MVLRGEWAYQESLADLDLGESQGNPVLKDFLEEVDSLERVCLEAIRLASTNIIITPAGRDGTDGAPGEDGPRGSPGARGIPGKTGTPGLTGLPGKTGMRGPPGTPGLNGMSGRNGTDGDPGDMVGCEEIVIESILDKLMKTFAGFKWHKRRKGEPRHSRNCLWYNT